MYDQAFRTGQSVDDHEAFPMGDGRPTPEGPISIAQLHLGGSLAMSLFAGAWNELGWAKLTGKGLIDALVSGKETYEAALASLEREREEYRAEREAYDVAIRANLRLRARLPRWRVEVPSEPAPVAARELPGIHELVVEHILQGGMHEARAHGFVEFDNSGDEPLVVPNVNQILRFS